jgi:hypothetical protein
LVKENKNIEERSGKTKIFKNWLLKGIINVVVPINIKPIGIKNRKAFLLTILFLIAKNIYPKI